MSIRRRFFEGKHAWLNRVLHLHDVDFAIATDSNKNQWLVFLESVSYGYAPYIGLHRMGEGLEIGRVSMNEDADISQYSFVFHTRNGASHVKYLEHSPDVMGNVALLKDQIHVLRQLATHEGIHIYTDPDGVKWYATINSNAGDQLRLWTKRAITSDIGRYGWVMMDLLDQYGGQWFIHRLTLDNREVIDSSVALTAVSSVPVRKGLREIYTLSEMDHDDSIVVLIDKGQGLHEKKSYRLTLDLTGMLEENQVLNIYYILNDIVQAEFPNRKVTLDLDRIEFVIDGEQNHGMLMHGVYGNKYFFNRPEGRKTFHTRDNGLFPRTY
jgi:hypothetical protein